MSDTQREPAQSADVQQVEGMPSILETVAPPVEHQYPRTENAEDNSNNTSSAKKVVAGVAAVAAVAGGAFALGANSGGEDEPSAPAVAEPNSETTTPLGEDPTQTTIEVTVPSDPVDVSTVDRGNGFVVPETAPEYSAERPQRTSTNNVSEILREIDEGSAYVMNTGDIEYADNILVSGDSEVGNTLILAYQDAETVRTRFEIPDFFYWVNYEPVDGSTVELDPSQGEQTIQVRSATLGFGGAVNTAHFESLSILEITLAPKEITVNGESLTVWVVVRNGEHTFDQYNDYSSLFSN